MITKNRPIIRIADLNAKQIANIFKEKNPNKYEKAKRIAELYIKWGIKFNIEPILAFAQMCHETGYLLYKGIVPESANNFAGIGATGASGVYNKFDTEELGVIAHLIHLAWYIFPDHLEIKDEEEDLYCSKKYDPCHFGTTHRANVINLQDLGGKWAVPGYTYGAAIAKIANEILGFEIDEEDEYDNFEKELTNYLKQFNRQWKMIIIHHTVTPKTTTVESIRKYHINVRKFIDIGYHFLVDYTGKLHYGRPLNLQGAHCLGKINNKKINEIAIGISCIGNFMNDEFTWEFQNTLERFLNIVMNHYNIPKSKLFGHKEVWTTACPGTNLFNWFLNWRNQ